MRSSRLRTAVRASLTVRSVSLIAVVVGAATATVIGASPWVLVSAFVVVVSVALAPAWGWSYAASGSVALALVLPLWSVLITPLVGARLLTLTAAAFVLAAGVAMLLGSRRGVRLPRLPVLDVVVSVGPAIITGLGVLAFPALRGGQVALAWAMRGDAQFNTVIARQIAEAQGETFDNARILSLAQGLLALVQTPGRSQVAASQLLLHDVSRQAELWILIVLASSVVAGLLAIKVLQNRSKPVRVTGALGAAAAPLTWWMTGYAFQSGFYNVSLALLVIELSVLFGVAGARSPARSVALQLLMTSAALGAWTPMAIIPLALAGASGYRLLRSMPSRGEMVVVALALAQMLGLSFGFVLPRFLKSGDILSANGTILFIPQPIFWSVLALTVLAGVAIRSEVEHSGRPEQEEVSDFPLSVIVLSLASAVGVLFLVFQNRGLDQPWIYYPIKFAWVAMQAMFIVGWVSAWVIIGRSRARFIRPAALGACVAVAIVGVMQLNPPPATGVLSYFPVLGSTRNLTAYDSTLRELSSVAGERVMFSRYRNDDSDVFANQWQFQLSAKNEFSPIRSFAYQKVETVREVCEAGRTWGGDVIVRTSSASWAERLDARCGGVLDAEVSTPR